MVALFQDWVAGLPLQMQVALAGVIRGPDGLRRAHPTKHVTRALRGCLIRSAYYGRELARGEIGDAFIDMSRIGNIKLWDEVISEFKDHVDELPIHYFQHLMQAINVLRFKHPDEQVRARWRKLHQACCTYMHVFPESAAALDQKLRDWDKRYWGKPAGYHAMLPKQREFADRMWSEAEPLPSEQWAFAQVSFTHPHGLGVAGHGLSAADLGRYDRYVEEWHQRSAKPAVGEE